MIEQVQEQTSEIFRDAEGAEIARRYDIANYMAGMLGRNWQVVVEALFDAHSITMVREVDEHETIIDLGAETPRKYRTEIIDPRLLEAAFGPHIMQVYLDQYVLMQEATLAVGVQDELGVYDEIEHALNPIYRQRPQTTIDDSISDSLEPHVDGRYSGVIVVRAPKHEGGELVILDGQHDELARLRHKDATLVCFPRGRELPHYTGPLRCRDDTRIVIPTNYAFPGETDEERDSVSYLGVE